MIAEAVSVKAVLSADEARAVLLALLPLLSGRYWTGKESVLKVLSIFLAIYSPSRDTSFFATSLSRPVMLNG